MCMSGAHYIIEEEEPKEEPKFYLCSYSGLPSILNYVEDDKKRKKRAREIS